MKNVILSSLLCLSFAGVLTSCHDSIETNPTSGGSGSGKIFYSQVDQANYQGKGYPVITAELDGSNPRVIAQGIGLSAAAGKVLYVVAHGEFQDNITISNDDGSSPKILFTYDSIGPKMKWKPVLSPDGSKVVYGFETPDMTAIDVKIQDVASGTMKTIDRVQKSETEPGFSSDSRYVLYYDASWQNQAGDLKIASADGSGVRILTTIQDPGNDYIGIIRGRPGTQQIAYFDQDQTYLINTDGTGKRLLVNGVTPAWSPDGLTLAYASLDTSADILVTSNLGVTSTNITATTSAEAYPVWSPDGKTIYALRWQGDYDHTTQSLIAVDIAGKSIKQLASPAQYLFVTK